MAFASILPPDLIKHSSSGKKEDGKASSYEKVSGKEIKAKKLGIYFSASWCPPCKTFTPILAEYYKKINAAAPGSLEVVFISRDTSRESFDKYFASMPWLAVNWGSEITKWIAKQVPKGIPCLLLLESEGTTDLNKDGVRFVEDQMKEM